MLVAIVNKDIIKLMQLGLNVRIIDHLSIKTLEICKNSMEKFVNAKTVKKKELSS
jgi:hypothetical protein